jgi:hypothetical protein
MRPLLMLLAGLMLQPITPTPSDAEPQTTFRRDSSNAFALQAAEVDTRNAFLPVSSTQAAATIPTTTSFCNSVLNWSEGMDISLQVCVTPMQDFWSGPVTLFANSLPVTSGSFRYSSYGLAEISMRLPPGTYTLSAVFVGNATYMASSSPPASMTVYSAHPRITSVRDVRNDQGGRVMITWQCDADRYSSDFAQNIITQYRIWRRAPAFTALTNASDADRFVRREVGPNGVTTETYWEAIATLPAEGLVNYAYTAATLQDSLADSNPYSAYMVTAVKVANIGGGVPYFESAPDSGYSVDNLSPPTPMPFVGQFSAAANRLHWTPSRAADFKAFELHRGLTRDFVPDASNLLYTGSDTGYVDAPGAYHYKLVALDVHGNASKPTLVSHNAPTAALASLVAAEALDDRVKVSWYLAGDPTASVTVQRRESFGAWQTVATVTADGTGLVAYEDTDVTPGGRYTYRLGVLDEGTVVYAGETPSSRSGRSPSPRACSACRRTPHRRTMSSCASRSPAARAPSSRCSTRRAAWCASTRSRSASRARAKSRWPATAVWARACISSGSRVATREPRPASS